MKTVHLGYAVGTGAPVEIPIQHLAVTGQTQLSGKTTTLEALVARAGKTAIAFLTKRGEASFNTGRRIAPYFRDRADWQFVTSIMDATLQEKNKFLRPWIMRICRTTKTLGEVQAKVREALVTAKGINEGVYTQLDAYLDLIVPEIDRADLADRLDLEPGLNVMDVIGFSTPMQMLFIQSALDWVNEHCRDTIVVIPEAWEMVPEGKGSPVKASAITLVRKGAGIGNFVWVDSQDMAGVDKTILRGCGVWLLGVQREANELKRNLASIPPHTSKPKAGEIALLERGQFFACFGRTVVKTYVQPAWMENEAAMCVALGTMPIDKAGAPPAPQPQQQEDEVDRAEADRLVATNKELQGQVAELEAKNAEAEQRGYESGMTAALRQAGEFWNAAVLDMRDKARGMTEWAEHLAGIAREGRWSLPRGAAKPGAAAESAAAIARPEPPAIDDGQKPAGDPASPSESAIRLLRVLVRTHPLLLPADRWAAFGGTVASGGSWNSKVKQLRDAGYIGLSNGMYGATERGIAASNETPEKPKTQPDVWALWKGRIRDIVGSVPLAVLSHLVLVHPRGLTVEQLGLMADRATSGGSWNSTLKALRDWECVMSVDDRLYATDKGLAITETKPNPKLDVAEILRKARVARMGSGGQRLYEAWREGATRAQLAERANVKMTGGHWNSSIKDLLDSGLVVEEDGKLRGATEDLGERRKAAA